MKPDTYPDAQLILTNELCKPRFNEGLGQYELISNTTVDLYPNTQLLLDTGFNLIGYTDFYLFISNREIQANNGVILLMGGHIIKCPLAHNTIKIMMKNIGSTTYKIKAGVTKIAQFVLVKTYPLPLSNTGVL